MSAKSETNLASLLDGAPASGKQHRAGSDGVERLLRWVARRRESEDGPPTVRTPHHVRASELPGLEPVIISLERIGFERRRIDAVLDDLWIVPAPSKGATVARVFVNARRRLEEGE